jgi:outer membrane immunogenic protein
MKRATTWGIGALALAGMALPASAADLGARPITKAPVAAPVPVFSWTGCYIGGNVGGQWANFDGDISVAAVPVVLPSGAVVAVTNDSTSGVVGGGQIGCQWQTGAWVFGIEGDGGASSLKRDFAVVNPVFPFVVGDAFRFENNWQASVRGRLGYAFDRWLIYATGGVQFTNVEATAALVGFPIVQVDKTLTGWTVGGGVEWAFTNNFSLGVEYRFAKYDNENFGFGTFAVLPTALAGFAANADLETHQVTARLNWRFNWFGGAPY